MIFVTTIHPLSQKIRYLFTEPERRNTADGFLGERCVPTFQQLIPDLSKISLSFIRSMILIPYMVNLMAGLETSMSDALVPFHKAAMPS